MKKLYAITTISLIAGCLFFYFLLGLKKSPVTHASTEFNPPRPDEPDEALLFEIGKTKDPATGVVPRERLDLAIQVQQQKFAEQAALNINAPVPGIAWTERGPDNVGGRTRAILFDQNDPTGRKVWAAGVGGGLWVTSNIYATPSAWTKVNDMFDRLSITCISQGGFPPNTLYFGTGEGWGNVDAIRGNGIWRSGDGGATWTQLPFTINNPDFRFVNDISFALNMGGPCGSSGTQGVLAATTTGVFKTTDEGATWSKVLGNGIAGATINAAADLESAYYYNYATLGLIHQGGGGIWRSCDAGGTWERIYAASADEQRIEISPHYLDAWQLYAAVQGNTTYNYGIKKLMKTSNADEVPAALVSWTDKLNPPWCDDGTNRTDFTRGQAWYDFIIASAPFFRTPANDHHFTAYVGGVDFHKTINSGSGWTQNSQWSDGCAGLPYLHADIHNIIFKPDPVNAAFFANELLVATDGGVYTSSDGGVSFSARNKTYNVTQFYSCVLHPTTTNYFLAGSQDNGTQKFTSAGMNATTNIVTNDHDGGFCHIDTDDPDIQIAGSTFNNYYISVDGGATFGFQPFNRRGSFINPTDYDDNTNILYCGDAPGTYFRWTNPGGSGFAAQVTVPNFGADSVTHVAISPTVANRVYFGMSNGSIIQVDDAHTGANKTGIVIRISPGNVATSCIAIDPSNENHMLVSYSNYGVISVYESSPGTGGSLSWNSVDGNPSLPDMPVRWCMFDPRSNDWAIIATELGVWSTDNLDGTGTNWSPINTGFARTRVDMLRFRASDRLLAAATHGRGLFTTTVPLGGVVPVTLVDFKGSLINNYVFLEWKTASEQNSKGFEIQGSDDGTHFRKLGFIPSHGNSNIIRHYSYNDPNLPQENNYYRLKQIDEDLRFEYSRVILVRNPVITNSLFRLLNNPFTTHLDLEFGRINTSKLQLRLLTIDGKLLMQNTYSVSSLSRTRIYLTNQTVPPGNYLLHLVMDNRRYVIRVRRE